MQARTDGAGRAGNREVTALGHGFGAPDPRRLLAREGAARLVDRQCPEVDGRGAGEIVENRLHRWVHPGRGGNGSHEAFLSGAISTMLSM